MKKRGIPYVSFVLIFTHLCFGVIITATDNFDGTCLITMNVEAGEGDIVGMALEVDCLIGEVTDVDITSYTPLMNVYIDYLHSYPGALAGEGHPICLDTVAGAADLPLDDFTISAAVLDAADAYTTVSFLMTASQNVTGTIQENAFRGGVVDEYTAYLDINPTVLDFTITVPEPATLSLLALGGLLIRKRK